MTNKTHLLELLNRLIEDPEALAAMSNPNDPAALVISQLKEMKQKDGEKFLDSLKALHASVEVGIGQTPTDEGVNAENVANVVTASAKGAVDGVLSGNLMGGLMGGFKSAFTNFVFGISHVRDYMQALGDYARSNWLDRKPITLEEAHENVEQRNIAARIAERTGLSFESLLPTLRAVDSLEKADKNKDGSLDASELQVFDRNHDKKLTENEIPEAMRAQFKQLIVKQLIESQKDPKAQTATDLDLSGNFTPLPLPFPVQATAEASK